MSMPHVHRYLPMYKIVLQSYCKAIWQRGYVHHERKNESAYQDAGGAGSCL
ncbi:hypothetical protein BGLY_2116 [Bacillus glycinifermentans]|nr:hypothetical protein BGLY_2116 [Bacillus glycinifermentans]